MANGFTKTTIANALRQIFTQNRIHDLTKPNSPMLAFLARKEDWNGGISGKLHTSVDYGKVQAVSPTFSTAQSGAGTKSNSLAQFQTDTRKLYSLARIDGELLARAKLGSGPGDAGVLMSALEMKFESAIKAFSQNFSSAIYRKGSGALGRAAASSAFSTTACTLTDVEDAHNFEVGMDIQLCDTETGGTLRDSGESVVLTGVNTNTGVLTASTTWTADINGAANSDFLYLSGSYDAAIQGLSDWLPPGGASTTFNNVDRSLSPQRLGGVAVDGTGKSIAQAILEGVLQSQRFGGSNHVVFLNTTDYITLLDQLGSQAVYDTLTPTANVSFDSVIVRGGRTPTKVMPDPYVPVGKGWGIDFDPAKIVLASVGAFPRMLDLEDGAVHSISDDDGYECRVGGYGNLIVSQPGAHFSLTNLGA